MKELANEVHAKDERYNELLDEFNNLPKDLTRTYYTNRILEIVKNVKKQKVDINKVPLPCVTCKTKKIIIIDFNWYT